MRYVGWFVGALTLGIGLFALRAATLSTHEPVPPGSSILVTLRGDHHQGEPSQSLEERATAVVLACRLEVGADPTGPLEVLNGDTFRVLLSPSLDRTDRKQLRGCLEDWRIDHVRLRVESMVEK